MFISGYSDQASCREKCSWGPVATSWSCDVGCRLSIWANTQRESSHQWCSKRHIIASQHGFLTFLLVCSLLSYFLWRLLPVLKPFSQNLNAVLSTCFLLNISIQLSLVSLSSLSLFILSCLLFSSFHVSLYSLVFPPPIFVVFEFNLTARLQKPICWKRNDPNVSTSLLPDQTCVLCSGPTVLLIGSQAFSV